MLFDEKEYFYVRSASEPEAKIIESNWRRAGHDIRMKKMKYDEKGEVSIFASVIKENRKIKRT